MTGDRCGVGRTITGGGCGEGEDPLERGVVVATATRARLVSSDPSADESPLLLVPSLAAEEVHQSAVNIHQLS